MKSWFSSVKPSENAVLYNGIYIVACRILAAIKIFLGKADDANFISVLFIKSRLLPKETKTPAHCFCNRQDVLFYR